MQTKDPLQSSWTCYRHRQVSGTGDADIQVVTAFWWLLFLLSSKQRYLQTCSKLFTQCRACAFCTLGTQHLHFTWFERWGQDTQWTNLLFVVDATRSVRTLILSWNAVPNPTTPNPKPSTQFLWCISPFQMSKCADCGHGHPHRHRLRHSLKAQRSASICEN